MGKQKQTTPMAITPPPLKRSYAAVVRNNINTSVVHLALNINKNENNTSNNNNNNKIGRTEKQAIIIESGIDSKSAMSCKSKPLGSAASNQACGGGPDIEVIGEDVHPYLKQLEQALELEIKYRVPVNDNPGGEMSGGITSGMRSLFLNL